MNLLDELKADIAGVKTLADWLGEGGKPVAQDHANLRGLACAAGHDGLPCPHNGCAGWLDTAKGAVADEIRRQLAVKHKLNITTPTDGELHFCLLCRCKLDLKVHVPIEHISAHTSQELAARYPAWCWQAKEMKPI